MSYDESVAHNDEDKCKMLADFFQSVYISNENQLNYESNLCNMNFVLFSVDILNFSVSEICKEFKELDVNKVPGPDNVPPICLSV